MNELYKNLDNLVKLRKMVEGKDTKYYSHTYLRGNNVLYPGPDVSIVMTSSNRSRQVYYTLKTISASLVAGKVNIVLVDDSDSDPILLEKLNEFLGSVYSIDFISINRSMKEWVNPCVNYNIGFQYIDKMCSKVVIQNGEVCHVGDVLNYVVTNVSDNEYHVFDVKGTDSLETNNKIYEMDNVREGIEIYNNPNLQWGVKDSCPEWYQIHTNPRNYHFLSCMTLNSFNNIKGFSYDYSYGIHYDDNDFLLKIKSSNINIITVNHILQNVGGIHLFHSYKEGYFNISINYDMYNLKVKYINNFGKYLELTDESNVNYRYNCLLNTKGVYSLNLENLIKVRNIVENRDTNFYNHEILFQNSQSPLITIVMTSCNRSKQVYFSLKTISTSSMSKYVHIVIVDDSTNDRVKSEELLKFSETLNSIDFISINISKKCWKNPCINYNIGFQYINNNSNKIIIQNGEVCHVGDLLKYVTNSVRDNEYHVFDVKTIDSFETNEKIYKLDNYDVSIYDNKELTWLCWPEGPTWYQHSKIRPNNYHFLSCMTIETFKRIKNFSYDYYCNMGYDDDDFLLKIKINRINIITIDHLVEKIGGIHLYHYRDDTDVSWKINNELFLLKIKYFQTFYEYLELFDYNIQNINLKFNSLVNTIKINI